MDITKSQANLKIGTMVVGMVFLLGFPMLASAMDEGADVRGYMHWSLIDNYEWGSYRPRFGLFDRERKPAAGCEYYGKVAATGRI